MIIGFCGYARSGKDTAAKALTDDGWERHAFADALKDDVYDALCRSAHAAAGQVSPEKGDIFGCRKELFRPLLVEYGRAMRHINPMYWVRRAETRLGRRDAVLTDVRYPNEAEWVHSLGGKVVLISRPWTGPANDEEATSIRGIVDDGLVDMFLSNSGSVDELHASVRAYAASLQSNPDNKEE